MRKILFNRIIWRGLTVLGLVLSSIIVATYPTLAAILKSWSFDQRSNQLKFTMDEPTNLSYFILREPTRIVIDLTNTQLGKVSTRENYPGLVRQVRLSQFQENVTRLVLELSPETVLSPEQVILQELHTDKQEITWVLRPLMMETNHNSQTDTSLIVLPPGNTADNSAEIMVTVPPLEVSSQPTRTNTPRKTSPLINFGDSLPTSQRTRISPNLMLKAGTKLNLRYGGDQTLQLQSGETRQEVLLLAEAIYLTDRVSQDRDQQKLIIPQGTPVIGRFETDNNGAYFITQAIAIGGQNFPLKALSTILKLENNNNSRNRQSVIIEPGFSLQVELIEDWGY